MSFSSPSLYYQTIQDLQMKETMNSSFSDFLVMIVSVSTLWGLWTRLTCTVIADLGPVADDLCPYICLTCLFYSQTNGISLQQVNASVMFSTEKQLQSHFLMSWSSDYKKECTKQYFMRSGIWFAHFRDSNGFSGCSDLVNSEHVENSSPSFKNRC